MAKNFEIKNKMTVKDTIMATGEKKPKEEKYKILVYMPQELGTYIKQRALDLSTPEHFVSLTEYVCGLIEADMKKHSKENS